MATHLFLLGSVIAASGAPDASAQDLRALDWLSGAWCGRQGSLQIEEHWAPPTRNGAMAVTRSVREGRTVAFEFLRIESGPEGVALLAQPQGRPATVFPLSEWGPRAVRFHQPAHDFPQTIRYWREDTVLLAEISGPGPDGERRMRFSYTPCTAG